MIPSFVDPKCRMVRTSLVRRRMTLFALFCIMNAIYYVFLNLFVL
ncbi:hypothetical protein IC582_027739 [Cucumis melo]